MALSWTDDDGGPGDMAGDGRVEPYASGGDTRDGGDASFAYGRAMPDDDLTGYGTQDSGSYDHGVPGTKAMRGDVGSSHSRATSAQKPVRDRGPSPDPDATVPGVAGTRKQDTPRLPTRVDEY